MKKKVIALIMIIPLIFLITIFSVGQVASILTEIPVSGIEIITQNEKGLISIDMAKYVNDSANYIYIKAQVEPANANNKDYYFEIDPVDDESEFADISIAEDTGLLSLHGTGKAKVTAISKDGGYKDSIIISVTSSKVISIDPILKTTDGSIIHMDKLTDYEYSVQLTPDDYQFDKTIYPANQATSSVSWTSSNENVFKINQVTGKAQARLSGNATITLDCENSIDGVFHPVVINVTVLYIGNESGMTIEGRSDNELLFSNGVDSVSFLIELENPRLGLGDDFFLNLEGDLAFLETSAPKYELLDTVGKHYRVTFDLGPGYPETLNFSFTIGSNPVAASLKLSFRDFSFNVYTSSHASNKDVIYQKKGDSIVFTAEGNPSDDDIIYEWYSSSNAVQIIEGVFGKYVEIVIDEAGDYDLTITAFKKVINGNSVERGAFVADITKTISVFRGILSIEFVDNSVIYGLENVLTVGDVIRDDFGYIYNYHHELKIEVLYDDGEVASYSDDIKFSVDDAHVAQPYTMGESIRLTINGDGVTKMTANWKNGVYFDQNVTASLKFRAVKGGVVIAPNGGDTTTNEQNYKALKTATDDGKKVILMKDVMLGWENMKPEELEHYSSTMYTDYDWTFYKTMIGERPKVRYLIEFKNDVYGNGYTINAENFTTAQDSTGVPLLFKGPLNFIIVGNYGSVKSQDNICFLVRKKGVLINNVNLVGCSDEKLKATVDNSQNPDDQSSVTESIDINKLNYVGTVLEISGDTTLLNSRISNGRTAIRIFGGETTNGDPIVSNYSDVNVAEERLKVRIESCIVRQAREFLIKIGSNRAVRAESKYTDDVPGADGVLAKLPTKSDGSAYPLYSESTKSDPYFYDNYVITDVTLKNSVLSNSGLFAIAMETHFNGFILSESLFAQGLASNSFASVLRMEGDVKIYDWKNVDSIDSSTLIEINDNQNNRFQINLAEMVKKVAELTKIVKDEHGNDVVVPKFPGILTLDEETGTKYAHAGIVFFGGGENYSYIDASNSQTLNQMSNYKMNLSVLADDDKGGDLEILQLAAGDADFSFYMFDSNSEFNYEKQKSELDSGKAYLLPIAPVEGD